MTEDNQFLPFYLKSESGPPDPSAIIRQFPLKLREKLKSLAHQFGETEEECFWATIKYILDNDPDGWVQRN